MQTTVTQNYSTGQKRPMCGLDYAMADIAAGRINHYNSLDDLIKEIG